MILANFPASIHLCFSLLCWLVTWTLMRSLIMNIRWLWCWYCHCPNTKIWRSISRQEQKPNCKRVTWPFVQLGIPIVWIFSFVFGFPCYFSGKIWLEFFGFTLMKICSQTNWLVCNHVVYIYFIQGTRYCAFSPCAFLKPVDTGIWANKLLLYPAYAVNAEFFSSFCYLDLSADVISVT